MTIRTLFSAVLAFGAASLAAIAVLSWGGSFSDRLDVLTHFAPLVVTASAGALLLSPLARGRLRLLAAALSALALVCTGALVAPELLAAARPRPPVAVGAERLRLLQYNVLFSNPDPAASVAYVLGVDADVVFLEEANGRGAAVAEALRKRYPHQITCTGPEGACGTRVLSRRAPLSVGRLRPGQEDGSIGAAWMTLPLADGGRATVVATHYTWPIPAGPQQAQSRALARTLRRFPRDTLIVAGDFNSTPWSFSLRRQDRAFGIERRTRALFSWPRRLAGVAFPFPLLPIDHLYAGPGWATASVRRGPRTPSDHYPVLVELARRSDP